MTIDEEYEKGAMKIQKKHERLAHIAEKKGYFILDDGEDTELLALAAKLVKKKMLEREKNKSHKQKRY